jgi:hypothetical protein
VLGGTAVVLSGCATATDAGPTESDSAARDSPTRTKPSPPATEPGYASCGPDTVVAEELDDPAVIPDPLTEDSVAAYVDPLERDIVLPPADDSSDGDISIGTIETEPVEYGYLATVPVTGGYYNEAADGTSTATVHADLGHHVATYFVTEQVVRRARETTAELDPREHGDVVVCEPG